MVGIRVAASCKPGCIRASHGRLSSQYLMLMPWQARLQSSMGQGKLLLLCMIVMPRQDMYASARAFCRLICMMLRPCMPRLHILVF